MKMGTPSNIKRPWFNAIAPVNKTKSDLTLILYNNIGDH